jgi:hypothetical protein
MVAWTVSSMLLITHGSNRSPVPRSWNVINTTTQKWGLLHFNVAGFKWIQAILYMFYERTQKTGLKCSLTSKDKFCLSSVPSSRTSLDIRAETCWKKVSTHRAAHTGEEWGRCGFCLTKISSWQLVNAHTALQSQNSCREFFGHNWVFHYCTWLSWKVSDIPFYYLRFSTLMLMLFCRLQSFSCRVH